VPVDVTALIRRIAEVCESEALQRGIEMHVPHADTPFYAFADPVRCEQIVWNLVTNALKFTGRGGKIDLRIGREGAMVRVDVADTGQGIEASALPHVFDMYRQGARNPTAAGLGIGLSLAKQLVEMHGGRIQARSDGPGRGTTLSVWLPAAAREPAPDEHGGEARPVAGARILLVDDDTDAAQSFAALLELEQASVRVARSGEEALALLEASPVDAVIADIHLPGMDGYAFLARVRADQAHAHVKALAVTAFGRDDDRLRAHEAGYDAHLSKPMDFPELLHTLDTLLSASRRKRTGTG
jgi:two-component system, chemotaxis family, CheB/CheR fusion protein